MTDDPHTTQLDLGKSLLLAELGEVSNNDLRIIVVEAVETGVSYDAVFGAARLIGPASSSRAFELRW